MFRSMRVVDRAISSELTTMSFRSALCFGVDIRWWWSISEQNLDAQGSTPIEDRLCLVIRRLVDELGVRPPWRDPGVVAAYDHTTTPDTGNHIMNNWFSSQSSSRHSVDSATQPKEETVGPSHQTLHEEVAEDHGEPQSPVDRPFVPVLSTPHDAILSELSGHSLNAGPLSPTNVVRSEAASSVPLPMPSLGSMERVDGTTSPSGTLGKSLSGADLASAQPGPSNATSPLPGPPAPELDQMFDPFTGQPIGFLPAHTPSHPLTPIRTSPTSRDASRERSETLQSQAQFEQAKEDLWSHVGKIRKLQSEIAGMHIDLEGIGQSGDAFGVSLGGGATGGVGGHIPKRPSGPGGRLHEDTIGGSEQWYEPEEEEKERKRVMDAEFTTLAETFEGRAGAINSIMENVRYLSL